MWEPRTYVQISPYHVLVNLVILVISQSSCGIDKEESTFGISTPGVLFVWQCPYAGRFGYEAEPGIRTRDAVALPTSLFALRPRPSSSVTGNLREDLPDRVWGAT